ncbi:MAG: hypothetical protein CSA62_05590 [Planctomycetota bacterium]|nr:MAG: hypothetical protein CSA62_05590 [Planctomycetota bacterium]
MSSNLRPEERSLVDRIRTRYLEDLRKHYESEWWASGKLCPAPDAPIDELPEGFAVLEFEREEEFSYATLGMSLPSDELPIELHLHAPEASQRHVEFLYAVAYYHRNYAPIRHWDTIHMGGEWVPGSTCCYGLVSLPYPDGPDLEVAELSDQAVLCLWLLPITEAENQFKEHYGAEALEMRFEDAELSYLDPFRDTVL